MEKLIDLEIGAKVNDGRTGDFNIEETYKKDLDSIKKDIYQKIKNLNEKLNKFQVKEGILDGLIATTNSELQNLKENEFTKRGQKQSILLKQLEALSVLHDTIMKYEDMIQKYQKTLMDIANNKLNSHIKIMNLYKEEEQADDSLGDVLKGLQSLLRADAQPDSSGNSLVVELEAELKELNYK